MPKTKIQKIIFSVFMAFMMVFGMESYNHIIANKLINFQMFMIPLMELAGLMAIVIILETFVAGKIARKLAFHFVNPNKGHPFVIILAIQISTVLLMCPLMSFVATIIFKNGFNGNILFILFQTIGINFPMALLWQIIIAGPIVRFIANKIKI